AVGEFEIFALRGQRDQFVGPADRQRTEQVGVDDAKDCGIDADPESESQYPDQSESGTFSKRPRDMSHILQYCAHIHPSFRHNKLSIICFRLSAYGLATDQQQITARLRLRPS